VLPMMLLVEVPDELPLLLRRLTVMT
jgi:hypothetical protein